MSKTKMMRTGLCAALFATLLFAAPAFARADDDKKPCCPATVEGGKKCAHDCCVKAAKEGKVCEKCHPKEEKK